MTTPAIVIPAAGLGKRMKSYGPKALIECAKHEPLICRQIRLLREKFDNPYIVVVLGYSSERIRKVLPPGIRVVINDDYAETNVAHSIKLGMSHCPPWLPLLIVFGDLVFNREMVKTLDLTRSNIIVDSRAGREEEVGLTTVSGEATYFSYGLPTKWAHIATLLGHEQEIYIDLMAACHRRKHFVYEVFNELLDRGGKLEVITNKKIKMVEVDSSKDIKLAQGIT